jgi:MoxR-like ATPase
MDIKQTKRTLMGLPPRHSVLIEGKHGLGKSEVVAQTAAELSAKLEKEFGFVDIRLGQYEIGDLIGIPRAMETFTVTHRVFSKGRQEKRDVIAKNVTIHDLPLWFPRDKDSYGFVFFDEINRGSRDTQQWAMQIVLDYRSNFVDVPLNWRVVAACNGDQDVYSVLNLDPALYDRFLVIKFNWNGLRE